MYDQNTQKNNSVIIAFIYNEHDIKIFCERKKEIFLQSNSPKNHHFFELIHEIFYYIIPLLNLYLW